MKGRNVFLIIFILVLADQVLKIYVKTHFHEGELRPVLGQWFNLWFVENEGMAYGWKFGGEWGKIILTLFRLAAVIFGIFYIRKIVLKNSHPGFIFCAALIFAGALGNLIDSMFYGLIFDDSAGMAISKMFPAHGYAGFLHGKVVDMLYFPLIHKNGNVIFFSPIFNLADASISTGVIAVLVFQKKFFRSHSEGESRTIETNAIVNDEVQVS